MDETISRLLGEVAHRFRRQLRRAPVLGELGITPIQAQLLAWVGRTEQAAPSAFAECVGRDRGQVTRLVAQLEALGLVARRPSATDGRVVHLLLTPSGRAAADELAATRQALIGASLRGLSPEEQATFARVLVAMRENLAMSHSGAVSENS